MSAAGLTKESLRLAEVLVWASSQPPVFASEWQMVMPSLANRMVKRRIKIKRAQDHRMVGNLIMRKCRKFTNERLLVAITRHSPRALDSDNLVSAGKNLRDGIADALRVDDKDSRVVWHVQQVIESKTNKASVQVWVLP